MNTKKTFKPNTITANGVTLKIDNFGSFQDIEGVEKPIRSFTWKNEKNVSIQVINYGATITKIMMPDRDGNVKDVALGYDNMNGYLQPNNPYFGATIGRVCNRISNGCFVLNNKAYQLNKNVGNTHLHGGIRGFDKVFWNYHVEGTEVIMTYLSKDGEEHYPGDVLVTVLFQLNNDNDFICEMKAVSTKPTPISLTNHTYFNLAGHDGGAKELYKHEVLINGDSYTPLKNLIPTGEIKKVAETIYDLQVPKVLGQVINKVAGGGYDINYSITKGLEPSVAFVARVVHPSNGRVLEVYSNQPGVQFYTANSMPTGTDEDGNSVNKTPKIIGKNNVEYRKHSSFCLETQNFPDAVNNINFPSPFYNPGQTYFHKFVYKFWVKN